MGIWKPEDGRYGAWAGFPKGRQEDKQRCVAEVQDRTGWHFYQCSRKRGFGPDGEWCKQHANKIAAREVLKGE